MATANGESPFVASAPKPPPPDTPDASPAWQPLTPQGVARFARATFNRLLVVEAGFALLTAGVMIWFLAVDWLPTVRAAISELPEQGGITNGTLRLPQATSSVLAESRLLAVSLDLGDRPVSTPAADVRIELHPRECRVASILGYLAVQYPPHQSIGFNRRELEPWWSAWEPFFLAVTGMAAVLGLVILWGVLAGVYLWVPKVVAFLADRELDWVGSWRLAAAALLPGALLMALAIVLYGLHVLDLVQLALLTLLHLLLGWAYLIASPFCLSKTVRRLVPNANPFVADEPAVAEPADRQEPPAGEESQAPTSREAANGTRSDRGAE